jgi:uncharacterized membrane protein YedE/YeeE
MSIILIVCFGLMIGVVFGFALEKSKVFEPGVIIAQFQFRKFIMLKVFLTAIATGLIVFAFFFGLGFDRLNWKTTIYAADIIGGLLLGIGIAVAGACPGTLFAQIGAGYKDSLVTFVGAVLGAITFIKVRPWLDVVLLNGLPQKKITLDTLLGLPFSVTACMLVLIIIALLYALELHKPWKRELDDNLDPCSHSRLDVKYGFDSNNGRPNATGHGENRNRSCKPHF